MGNVEGEVMVEGEAGGATAACLPKMDGCWEFNCEVRRAARTVMSIFSWRECVDLGALEARGELLGEFAIHPATAQRRNDNIRQRSSRFRKEL